METSALRVPVKMALVQPYLQTVISTQDNGKTENFTVRVFTFVLTAEDTMDNMSMELKRDTECITTPMALSIPVNGGTVVVKVMGYFPKGTESYLKGTGSVTK
jgi:hypothetical protein